MNVSTHLEGDLVPAAWLTSGKPALLAGMRLRLREHRFLPGSVLVVTKGQASSYWLETDDRSVWILKRFLPAKRPERAYIEAIAARVPQTPQFRSGWQRRVLNGASVTAGAGAYDHRDLGDWVDGAVLMPRVDGETWADLLSGIADGSVSPTSTQRLAIAQEVAAAVLLLELSRVSHRDLSCGNILVNLTNGTLQFVDWDALYHESLRFQRNTTLGTLGYTAPWIAAGADSWCEQADRFALAVCIAEVLTVTRGTTLYGDGCCFDQPALSTGVRAAATLGPVLAKFNPHLAELLMKSLAAKRFAECPSPVDWLNVLCGIAAPPPTVQQALASIGKETSRLREALLAGDDAAIVPAAEQEAQSPLLAQAQLSQAEREAVAAAVRRRNALDNLGRAVLAEDDAAIAQAFWQALELGAEADPAQRDAALAAVLHGQMVPRPSFEGLFGWPPLLAPAEPLDQVFALFEQQRQTAAAELRAALDAGEGSDVRALWTAARRSGAIDADDLWQHGLDATQRGQSLAALHQALEHRDDAAAGRLWRRISVRWPEQLARHPAIAEAGIAAYRRWGRQLRSTPAPVQNEVEETI